MTPEAFDTLLAGLKAPTDLPPAPPPGTKFP